MPLGGTTGFGTPPAGTRAPSGGFQGFLGGLADVLQTGIGALPDILGALQPQVPITGAGVLQARGVPLLPDVIGQLLPQLQQPGIGGITQLANLLGGQCPELTRMTTSRRVPVSDFAVMLPTGPGGTQRCETFLYAGRPVTWSRVNKRRRRRSR